MISVPAETAAGTTIYLLFVLLYLYLRLISDACIVVVVCMHGANLPSVFEPSSQITCTLLFIFRMMTRHNF